jgi:hypothetical protein
MPLCTGSELPTIENTRNPNTLTQTNMSASDGIGDGTRGHSRDLSMLSCPFLADQEEEGPFGDQAEKFAGLIACNFS